MNKILKFNFALLAGLALTTQSCYEDKGNYDYRELTALSIDTLNSGIKPEMIAYQLENFKMPVNVKYAGDKNKLEYEWKLFPQDPQKPDDVVNFDDPVILSTQEVLDTTIYEVPGKYYLVYTVTDPTHDVKEYLRIKLSIESALSRGLCVLDEKAGNYDLHMIKTATLLSDITPEQEKTVKNIFSNVNDRIETSGRFIHQFTPGWGSKVFYFFTETGGYTLDPNTFEITSDDYKSLFSFPMAIESNPQAYMVTSNPAEIIVNNGLIHAFDHVMMGASCFGDRLEGDYYAAPFLPKLTSDNFATVIYDTKNARFAPIDRWISGVGSFVDTEGAEFNLNNIGRNMEIKFMQNGYNEYTYAIFKNIDNSNYFLYVTDFSGENEMPIKKYDMSGCPELRDNSIYTFGTRGNVCFYTSGSNLYQYKYASKNAAEVVHQFGSETITTIEVFEQEGHELDGKLLMISTVTASGEGKVYLLPFDELNGTLNTLDMNVYTGFNKIVDVYFKE